MLRFFDGGALYYTTMLDKWDVVTVAGTGASATVSTTGGRWGGRCIQLLDTAGQFNGLTLVALQRNLSGGLSEYVTQFAYNCVTLFSAVGAAIFVPFINFREGTTAHVEFRLNTTNNTITAARGGTVFATSANNAWSTSGGWRYCQIKVKVHDTTGTIKFIQDGVTIFDLTGQDTQAGLTGVIDNISIGWPTTSFNDIFTEIRYQDIAICDTTGPAPLNDIHPEGRVHLLATSAEGDTNDWAPSTGSDNEALIDEIPNNGDTDYVSSAVSGDIDLYTLDDLPLTPTTIYGVGVHSMVAKTEGGPAQVSSVLKTNGTVYSGDAVSIASTQYQKVNYFWEENPDTSNAWTKSEVDALQAGIKRIS